MTNLREDVSFASSSFFQCHLQEILQVDTHLEHTPTTKPYVANGAPN